jgi:hypothetical protein
LDAALAEAVASFLAAGEARVCKTTKRATTEIDIRPLVLRLDAAGDALRMTVRAGSADNVKPDMVLDALNAIRRGAHPGEPPFCRISLHRAALYVSRGGALAHPLSG